MSKRESRHARCNCELSNEEFVVLATLLIRGTWTARCEQKWIKENKYPVTVVIEISKDIVSNIQSWYAYHQHRNS